MITNLDGKDITYSKDDTFYVQVGKGKGKYKNRYTIKGNLTQAVMWYNGINLRKPYKKRLLMGVNVLVRQIGV